MWYGGLDILCSRFIVWTLDYFDFFCSNLSGSRFFLIICLSVDRMMVVQTGIVQRWIKSVHLFAVECSMVISIISVIFDNIVYFKFNTSLSIAMCKVW